MSQRLLIQVLALNGAVVTGVLRPLELGNPALGVVDVRDQRCARVVSTSYKDGITYHGLEYAEGASGWASDLFLRGFEPVETLELGPIPALSAEELATTLAGLRMLQSNVTREDLEDDPLQDILTSDGGEVGDLLLNDVGIDALCDRLNGDDGRPQGHVFDTGDVFYANVDERGNANLEMDGDDDAPALCTFHLYREDWSGKRVRIGVQPA